MDRSKATAAIVITLVVCATVLAAIWMRTGVRHERPDPEPTYHRDYDDRWVRAAIKSLENADFTAQEVDRSLDARLRRVESRLRIGSPGAPGEAEPTTE